MKLTDMNQFLATQTLKNQDLIKDILLIFSCFYDDKMTEKHEKDHNLEQFCSEKGAKCQSQTSFCRTSSSLK